MPKKLLVAVGGRGYVFTNRRSYFMWIVSTRDGWKFLKAWLVFRLVHPAVRVLAAVENFMRKPG